MEQRLLDDIIAKRQAFLPGDIPVRDEIVRHLGGSILLAGSRFDYAACAGVGASASMRGGNGMSAASIAVTNALNTTPL